MVSGSPCLRCGSASPAIGPEHQVSVKDDAERPAGTGGDGGLDVEVALGEALADVVHVVLDGLADGLNEIALVVAEGELGPDGEQRR